MIRALLLLFFTTAAKAQTLQLKLNVFPTDNIVQMEYNKEENILLTATPNQVTLWDTEKRRLLEDIRLNNIQSAYINKFNDLIIFFQDSVICYHINKDIVATNTFKKPLKARIIPTLSGRFVWFAKEDEKKRPGPKKYNSQIDSLLALADLDNQVDVIQDTGRYTKVGSLFYKVIALLSPNLVLEESRDYISQKGEYTYLGYVNTLDTKQKVYSFQLPRNYITYANYQELDIFAIASETSIDFHAWKENRSWHFQDSSIKNIQCIAFIKGTDLAAIGTKNGKVLIINWKNQQLVTRYNISGYPISGLKYSDRKKQLAISFANKISFIQVNEERILNSSIANAASGIKFSTSKNGRFISLLSPSGKLLVFQFPELRIPYFTATGIAEFSISNDETLMLVKDSIQKKSSIYSLTRSNPQFKSQHEYFPLTSEYIHAPGPEVIIDSQYILRQNFEFEIIDLQDPLNKYSIARSGDHTIGAYHIKDRFMYAITGNRKLIKYDLERKKKLYTVNDFSNPWDYTRISADGKLLLVWKKDIEVFDAEKGKKILTLPNNIDKWHYDGAAFIDGDSKIIGWGYNWLQVFDTKTGTVLLTMKRNLQFLKDISNAPVTGYLFLNFQTYTEIVTLEGLKKVAGFNLISNQFALFSYSADGLFDGDEKLTKYIHYVADGKIIPVDAVYNHFYTPGLLKAIFSGQTPPKPDLNIRSLFPEPVTSVYKSTKDTRGLTISEKGESVSQAEYSVSVRSINQGGGISEVLLFQNHKLVQSWKEKFAGDTIMLNFNLKLLPGANIIKAVALNTQGLESLPSELNVNYKDEGKAKKASLYLLVIGINEYKNASYKLNYAVPDALSIKEKFAANGSLFDSTHTYYIFDSLASKKNIESAFTEISAKITEKDVFIFYYAGHGFINHDNGSTFYLVPYDVTQMYQGANKSQDHLLFSDKDLKQQSIRIKAQKQVYFLDACNSGGALDQLKQRGLSTEQVFSQLARSTGTYWVAAATANQYANEIKELGHGIFTYSLVNVLSAKRTQDQVITIQGLIAELNKQVPELSKKYKASSQYPVSFSFGQDFPIFIVN
ncbi:MAG: caspase family protein [Ferruginibacter sp.]